MVVFIVIPSEEHHLEMFPMDFEEFLWATGNCGMLPIIERAYRDSCPVGAGMHRRILDVFRQYLVVGGMPQVVSKFAETRNLRIADAEKRDILELYRSDIFKFGGRQDIGFFRYSTAFPVPCHGTIGSFRQVL